MLYGKVAISEAQSATRSVWASEKAYPIIYLFPRLHSVTAVQEQLVVDVFAMVASQKKVLGAGVAFGKSQGHGGQCDYGTCIVSSSANSGDLHVG